MSTDSVNAAGGPPAGTLFVVAAPSGAGKSSLVNALLEREPAISLSVSHTTRPPRQGEQCGRHYFFVERSAFEREVAEGIFLEHAEVHGNLYGTSRTTVQSLLGEGRDVLLEIDWQGARQVRAQVPDAVSVFILPPSRVALEQRMLARGQDGEDVIRQRLAAAREEMTHFGEFDYVIVNEHFNKAVDEMCSIFTASRLRREAQVDRHAGLIRALLAGP